MSNLMKNLCLIFYFETEENFDHHSTGMIMKENGKKYVKLKSLSQKWKYKSKGEHKSCSKEGCQNNQPKHSKIDWLTIWFNEKKQIKDNKSTRLANQNKRKRYAILGKEKSNFLYFEA